MRCSTVFFAGIAMLPMLGAAATCSGERIMVADRGGKAVVSLEVHEDATMSYLDRLSFDNKPVYGLGPIDLALDEARNIMFVSFETVNINGQKDAACRIALIDLNTFTHIKDIVFPEADDFGGLCYDSPRGRLYAIERNTNMLYVLRWHPQTQTLEYEDVVLLSGITYACAIAVDGDSAYVTEYRYFDPMRYFEHIKEYDISKGRQYVRTIANGDKTTCLAYDSGGKIFYSNAYDYQGSYHHMIKHGMDPNEVIVKDIGGCMIDGDVDEATGLVYVTSYHGADFGQWGDVEVWDTSGWVADPNQAVAAIGGYSYNPNGPADEMLAGPAGVLLAGDVKPLGFSLSKDDGLDENNPEDYVLPDDEITYTITVDPSQADHAWLTVVDHLPAGVFYPQGFPQFDPNDPLNPIPADPAYDPSTHTYTWQFGEMSHLSDPLVLTLTVTVNDIAPPGGLLVNEVIAESDVAFEIAYEQTRVCCFGGEVVYVNHTVPDGGNGTSWALAYNDLSDAIEGAATGCANEIRVARGPYKPGPSPTDTFEIPAGVSVYGGFAGYETSIDQRNVAVNQTILSGYIRTFNNIEQRNETVVTMGDNTLLDGFIVKESILGIDGSNVSSTVANCIIRASEQIGVYCSNGNLTVRQCELEENGYQGVYHRGHGYLLDIAYCTIHDNHHDGITIENSSAQIKNSVIYNNGSDGSYFGIFFAYPSSNPAIHNNTIAHNTNEGISFTGYYTPDIRNCILWGNNDDGAQLAGMTHEDIYHSCIPDCNDVNPQHNINDDPQFAYSFPGIGSYHLTGDSPCIDKGDDAYVAIDETDVDGDDRLYGLHVDIGADEFTCGDVSSIADLNADGVVNFVDFAVIAATWLSSDPNEPGITTDPNFIGESHYRDPITLAAWSPQCNFDSDYDIDLNDLAYFTYDGYWLWIACWRNDLIEQMGMSSSGGAMLLVSEPVAAAEEIHPQQSIEERHAQALEVTVWLEKLWFEDEDIRSTIDKDDWKLFMNAVYDWLDEFELAYNNDKD